MDEDDTDFFISLALEVKLMRFIGRALVPSWLSMSVAVDRGDGSTDEQVEVALRKWRYFLDNIVSKSVAFCKDNDDALDILLDDNGINRTTNLFVLTPQEPSDEMLATLFQAKMNALGCGHLVAISVEIASDNLNGLSFTLLGDHAQYLPTTVEEYLGPSFWEKPWWHRDDASSIDVRKIEDDQPTPAWAYSLDFLERNASAMTSSVIAERAPFKPTVIDGGKPKPK